MGHNLLSTIIPMSYTFQYIVTLTELSTLRERQVTSINAEKVMERESKSSIARWKSIQPAKTVEMSTYPGTWGAWEMVIISMLFRE